MHSDKRCEGKQGQHAQAQGTTWHRFGAAAMYHPTGTKPSENPLRTPHGSQQKITPWPAHARNDDDRVFAWLTRRQNHAAAPTCLQRAGPPPTHLHLSTGGGDMTNCSHNPVAFLHDDAWHGMQAKVAICQGDYPVHTW